MLSKCLKKKSYLRNSYDLLKSINIYNCNYITCILAFDINPCDFYVAPPFKIFIVFNNDLHKPANYHYWFRVSSMLTTKNCEPLI